MSTNISGQKREALISEIYQIKSFIEENAKDENAAQLIAYLGDLFREVNGKKYGLVFEEHRPNVGSFEDVLTEGEGERAQLNRQLFVLFLILIGQIRTIQRKRLVNIFQQRGLFGRQFERSTLVIYFFDTFK